jgi:hypothetical protein
MESERSARIRSNIVWSPPHLLKDGRADTGRTDFGAAWHTLVSASQGGEAGVVQGEAGGGGKNKFTTSCPRRINVILTFLEEYISCRIASSRMMRCSELSS